MKREDFNRILRQMEQCREMSYEAETKQEENRLIVDYNRMAKVIKPYIEDPSKLED